MASRQKLRGLWFKVHKWIGLAAALLIIPVSLSGAALVWHDWLDERLNPDRYAVTGPATLPPARYAEAARTVLTPDQRTASLRYPEHGHGPVMVSAVAPAVGSAQPQRTNIWLDGASGRVLDQAGSNDGAVRFLHVLHGRLIMPGMGRQIVGWVGVAMLASSLAGLWLWWPISGGLGRGLRWNRRSRFDLNLHRQMGFWICIPLAMLSFTGAWISFPAFFGSLIGEKPPSRPAPAAPIARPALAINDVALKAGAQPVSITWPTDQSPVWKVALDKGEAEVVDATGSVIRKPPRPETIAGTMRRLHDGTGMGPVWQVAIFLGGLIPAGLAVTGITMWLGARKWRKRPERRLAPAE